MTRHLPMDIPTRVLSLTPDVPKGVFSATFRAACAHLDLFIEALLVELATELELADGKPHTAEALLVSRGWNPAGKLPLHWVLENLELFGHAELTDSGYVVRPRLPVVGTTTHRERAEAGLPAAAPAFEVLARSAQALAPVLRGEMRGEDALFGPATLNLWFDYFSNSNPLYYPNNAIAAVGVARHVGPQPRILELGGGGGSAAEAVLAALADAGIVPSAYCFSELQAAFLRRGTRAVRAAAPAGCEVSSKVLDINHLPTLEMMQVEPFDAIVTVNTLHLASDLLGCLAGIRDLLRPGGVLVLGELIRPAGAGAVHLELPFTLLGAYREVPLTAGVRPRPGFLTLAGWREALRRAGFGQADVIPATLDRCIEAYAGFYAGALVAS
ncbi:MAG TPA: class I SAM-dependent methyltransferase [Thermoanaerobaculaceae bacterium]|nr:class I SAM-dependent methyltransferase [Thermoanaerobaculaceae bacterium]HPS79452.1 class I SAM-dependent methyltransferase [Thermoanaerobaculaceae bacterium]